MQNYSSVGSIITVMYSKMYINTPAKMGLENGLTGLKIFLNFDLPVSVQTQKI